MRGTFERITVKNNKALTGNGGGIHNTGSDELAILDSHVEGNTALNGGGLAIQSDAPIVVKGSLFLNNRAHDRPRRGRPAPRGERARRRHLLDLGQRLADREHAPSRATSPRSPAAASTTTRTVSSGSPT